MMISESSFFLLFSSKQAGDCDRKSYDLNARHAIIIKEVKQRLEEFKYMTTVNLKRYLYN